ncbi:MAG: M20/M25/M40 family metallo-hydrolase [Flavobacteriaceae bacterium]|nr:M20/M25/M40 family metallo-hydrolase [Flavobacteriaceae bacterium]MBT6170282.1 M20/M25/M40 family metallo-hydrolase [Flavobacteriaceae bacterium]MDG1830592.1 M20/M25/M40 family metallo-hydrolase [Flavobacteriaceae bacterium]
MKQFFLLLLTFSLSIQSQESKTTDVIDIIKKHGMEKSNVMEIAHWITDYNGPRLTGSPGLDNATKWVVDELNNWGMNNVHLQEWGPFGRGWEMTHFEMHANSPDYWPIIAYPKAWSSSASGEGEAVFLDIKDKNDIEKYRGKLSNKFILIDSILEINEAFKASAKRHDDKSLLELANANAPSPNSRRYRNFSGNSIINDIWNMLDDERPIAVLNRSYKGELGTVFVSGARSANGNRRDIYKNDKYIIPQVTLAMEHYNRIFRITQQGTPVNLSIDFKSNYTNPDGMEHNIIAEITGTDLKDEVVMFGAHFDSWHTGTGATDNASGSAVMMEAARILLETIKESGIKPRRTLRMALWTGEEQGLLGSRAYVAENFADFNGFRVNSLKPEQKKVSAYYNLDNGTGKIRGVYLQGNDKVSPIFREWLSGFKDMDASTLSISNTGGTDHLAFDMIGIPGFQFIQEPIAYSSKTHHSNMDNYDHLVEDDLKQAATIIAYFIWQTSQRDEKLPRKENNLKYSN